MFISAILASMTVLDNELDVTAGGADETRAIAAIDMAQDAFEGVIANVPDLLGTIDTIATVANQENTAWPSELLRVDTLWLLDANGKQRWEVNVIQDVGAQTPTTRWGAMASGTGGAPTDCYSNRANFYWRPLPDAVHTVRVYGLYEKPDITLRTETFAYSNLLKMPIAAYAVRLMEMGIDDPSEELKALAEETFNPVIDALKRPIRQRPQARQYSRVHTT